MIMHPASVKEVCGDKWGIAGSRRYTRRFRRWLINEESTSARARTHTHTHTHTHITSNRWNVVCQWRWSTQNSSLTWAPRFQFSCTGLKERYSILFKIPSFWAPF